MSLILDQITVGSVIVAIVDQDPRLGDGLDLVITSLAMVQGEAGIYQKTGPLPTDWTLSSVDIGALELEDLTNVSVGSKADGQVLFWNQSSGKWESKDYTLQEAYKQDPNGGGATITTDADDGDVIIAGSEKLKVTASGGFEMLRNDVTFNLNGYSGSTSDDSPYQIASYSPDANSVDIVKVFISGIDSSTMDSVSYEKTVKVKNNSGSVSLGAIQSDYTSEDESLKAAKCSFSSDGSSVSVNVIGVAGKSIDWACYLQRVKRLAVVGGGGGGGSILLDASYSAYSYVSVGPNTGSLLFIGEQLSNLSGTLSAISVWFNYFAGNNVQLDLYVASMGVPSGAPLATATINGSAPPISQVDGTDSLIDFVFSAPVILSSSNQYVFVVTPLTNIEKVCITSVGYPDGAMVGAPGYSGLYDGVETAVNGSYSIYENDYGIYGKGRDVRFKLS